MTQTVNTFLSEMDENPELEQAVRSRILGEDMLGLPPLVRENGAQIAQLTQTLADITGKLEAVVNVSAVLSDIAAQHEERLERNEAAILEFRRDMATQQVQLQTLESKVDGNTARLESVETKVDANTAGLQRLSSQVGNLRGVAFERKTVEGTSSWLVDILDLRPASVAVLASPLTLTDPDFKALLYQSRVDGLISKDAMAGFCQHRHGADRHGCGQRDRLRGGGVLDWHFPGRCIPRIPTRCQFARCHAPAGLCRRGR